MERVKGILPSSCLASLIALPKVATFVTSLSCSNLSGNNTGNRLATEWQHYGQADFGPGDHRTKDRRNPKKLNASDGVRNFPRPPKTVWRMRSAESVEMCVML